MTTLLAGTQQLLVWQKTMTTIKMRTLYESIQVFVCGYRCVAVLGDMIPVRGKHYWEAEADDGTEFRIGVAYEDTEKNSYLGANSTSWCMRHILSPTR